MINVTKNTKEIKGRIMSDEMRKIIEACYQHFSKFQKPSQLSVCSCGFCVSSSDVEYLLSQSLKEILVSKIYCYMDDIGEDSISAPEILYFLPRVLELIAYNEHVAMCTELYLQKFGKIKPNHLDQKDFELVNHFALQFWMDWLQSVSERTTQNNYELSEVLVMFAYANLSIEPLLNHLNGLTNFWVVSKIAELIFDEREEGTLTNAFANHCMNINSEINQWLQNNAKTLSKNAQVAVLNMPDLAWQNKTKIDYLRDEYLLAMCDEANILATLPSNS